MGNNAAVALPGKILVYLRWGPDDASFTGNANAYPPPGAGTKPPSVNDVIQNYVALETKLDLNQNGFLNLLNGAHVAHELGHYLGLYHTFPGWSAPGYGLSENPTRAQADQAVIDYIAANGGTADALNGDALQDTPPDPTHILYQAHGVDDCSGGITVTGTMNGVSVSFTFVPDQNNVMSYFGGCNGDPMRFSPGQIRQMHQTLRDPARKHLVGP